MNAATTAIAVLAAGLLATLASAQDAPDEAWQVVLLKPKGCVACVYLEETLKRRGNLQRVMLDAGGGQQVTAAIERRSSAELTPVEWQEVAALPYVDTELWQQQARQNSAQLLLKHDGRVVAAGNIAQSADLRGAEFPLDMTMPAHNTSVNAVQTARQNWYPDYFLRHWSLDYFYKLALRPELSNDATFSGWLTRQRDSSGAGALAQSNVLLMSTASGAADNEIFNALRIEEIRGVLTSEVGVAPAQLRVFYGGGNRPGANAVEIRQGRLAFTRRDIEGAEPFTLANLAQIFKQVRAESAQRNLLVLIGHGGPDGAGMWASPAGLPPTDLRALHELGGSTDVLVSGNCFGGVMARSTSCGFFGARPDLIATGCQADAAEVAQSQDYLHVFFGSLTAAQRAQADADHDGAISFSEAHWQASVAGDQRNVTYSTVDALAEDYFAAHPDELPKTLRVSELRELARGAAVAEVAAVQRLTANVNGDVVLTLTDIAGQATRWRGPADGIRPIVSQLAKRLLYTQRHGAGSPELQAARSCGDQSIAAFLQH
ncbi:MAG: hypothetical protein ABI859_17815 [Pseudomonadota bacterium]